MSTQSKQKLEQAKKEVRLVLVHQFLEENQDLLIIAITDRMNKTIVYDSEEIEFCFNGDSVQLTVRDNKETN